MFKRFLLNTTIQLNYMYIWFLNKEMVSASSVVPAAMIPNTGDLWKGVVLRTRLSQPSVYFQLRKHYYCTDCKFCLASASARQKCPESSVYGCTNRRTRHHSWLCITVPNSCHAISLEHGGGGVADTNCRYNQSTFLQLGPSRRNNRAKTADGKEIHSSFIEQNPVTHAEKFPFRALWDK